MLAIWLSCWQGLVQLGLCLGVVLDTLQRAIYHKIPCKHSKPCAPVQACLLAPY